MVSDKRRYLHLHAMLRHLNFACLGSLKADIGWHFQKCALFRKISTAAIGRVILNLKRLHAGRLDMMLWHNS